jgi:hypothetical protein
MRYHTFALALLATLPLAAQAADGAGVLSTSSVSLSNLQVRLIDLTPDDGIAAGVRFSSLGVLANDQITYLDGGGIAVGGPTYSNSLLPTTPLSYQNGYGVTSNATPGGISVNSQITAGQLLSPEAGYDPTAEYNYTGAYVDGGAGLISANLATYDGSPARFTLAPNTALLITGTANLAVSVDTSALLAALADLPVTGWTLSRDYNGSSAQFSLNLYEDATDAGGSTVGSVTQSSGIDLSLGQSSVVFSSETPELTTWSNTVNKPFALTVVNANGVEQSGDVNLSVYDMQSYSLALQAALPVDPGGPGVVPEPGTYALMALGLAGLGVVSRRKAAR